MSFPSSHTQHPPSAWRPAAIKFENIHNDIILTLLQFEPMLYVRGLRLSKKWREQVQEAIDDFCNPMENHFV